MTTPGRPPISTHILDTSRGVAAAGVEVHLFKNSDKAVSDETSGAAWTLIRSSETNADGRCADLITSAGYAPGRYMLRFNVGKYFAATNTKTLYPYVEIVFECNADQQHYHIPLLLNPFGYSTYRGT